jgi:hypothetical protein
VLFFATIKVVMTNYHVKPLSTLSSIAAQEAREKRRKQLQQVQERRKVIYNRFREKIKHSNPSEFETA